MLTLNIIITLLYSLCVLLCVQNTYTNDPLVCAVGGDDGSIEPDQ